MLYEKYIDNRKIKYKKFSAHHKNQYRRNTFSHFLSEIFEKMQKERFLHSDHRTLIFFCQKFELFLHRSSVLQVIKSLENSGFIELIYEDER